MQQYINMSGKIQYTLTPFAPPPRSADKRTLPISITIAVNAHYQHLIFEPGNPLWRKNHHANNLPSNKLLGLVKLRDLGTGLHYTQLAKSIVSL